MTTKTKSERRRGYYYYHESINDLDHPGENSDRNLSSFEDVIETVAFTGDDRPNWRSVIREHGNATNSFSGNSKKVKFGSCTFDSTIKRFRFDGGGGTPPVPPVLINNRTEKHQGSGVLGIPPNFGGGIPNSVAVDLAKARFVSKARSRMSPASGGVILGEIRDTIRTIRHPADALRRGLSSYLNTVKKRGRGMKKASSSKKNAMVSSTWLEYTFGWKPLLSDIRNGAEALAQVVTKVRSLDPIRASGSIKDVAVPDFAYGSVGTGVQSLSFRVDAIRQTSAYMYGAVNTVVDSNIPTVRSAFGLRPHDVAPTIWELIPWSFVVDYFSNVGDIISCASFASRYMAWWGGSVVTEVTTRSFCFIDDTAYFNVPNVVALSGSCSGSGTRIINKSITRTVQPSLIPDIHFRIPGSPGVGFNLAALLAQSRAVRL